MSNWTYVKGTVEVSPMGRTQAEKRYILETVLNHLPIVEGSEDDMHVYIIQKDGHNSSCSCDEFGESTDKGTDWHGNRTGRRGMFRTQDNYILVVDGALRDTEFDGTYRAFQKWLCRLAKRIDICNVLVDISDYQKSVIVKDRNISKEKYSWDTAYGQMFEKPSWCYGKDEFGEPNWCEFMLYDKAKNSDYPMLLGYKYFADEENDEEVERRLKYGRS